MIPLLIPRSLGLAGLFHYLKIEVTKYICSLLRIFKIAPHDFIHNGIQITMAVVKINPFLSLKSTGFRNSYDYQRGISNNFGERSYKTHDDPGSCRCWYKVNPFLFYLEISLVLCKELTSKIIFQ